MMRYERFVEQGRDRWERFEEQLDRFGRSERQVDHAELERLSVEYRQLLHDHALAGSRYPGTWADERLRRLAIRSNHLLQFQKANERIGVFGFFRRVFPRCFRELSGELVVCTVLFLTAALLGVALTAVEPAVGTAFIGEEAVAGLERGEIWTDQIRDSSQIFSSLIAVNNMKVAITAWAGGLIAGLGSFAVLFVNGFMLGAVVVLTVHFGMSRALLEFISAHGPLELSLIVVCAAAGVHVGRTLVSSSVEPLSVRLPQAGRRSVSVLLGCLPWFLLLGFVEGFVSPAPNIEPTAKLGVGLLLLVLFLLAATLPGRSRRQPSSELEPGRNGRNGRDGGDSRIIHPTEGAANA